MKSRGKSKEDRYRSDLFHCLAQMIVDGKESRPDRFHHEFLRASSGFDDIFHLVVVHAQRLFAENVFVVFQRFDRQFAMRLFDRADVDDVDVFISINIFLRSVHSNVVAKRKVLNEFLRLRFASSADGNDAMFSRLTGQQGQTEILTNASRSNDSPP